MHPPQNRTFPKLLKMVPRFFCSVDTNTGGADAVQVQLHLDLGGHCGDNGKRPPQLPGDGRVSIHQPEAASCRSSIVVVAPPPIRPCRKRKRIGVRPAVECDDRRMELKRVMDYGSTRMSLFLRKKETKFVCKCCFNKYPNKEVDGKVITDRSSLPACKRCSDICEKLSRRLRAAIDDGFGDPDSADPNHIMALSMQTVAKSHRGQHGASCAACAFLASCRRAHQWDKMEEVDIALGSLLNCPRKWAVAICALADEQARARVRGRNQAKVDKTLVDSAADIQRVYTENIRRLIMRVERCAGVLHVEVPDGTEAKEAPELAAREAKGARPHPMFIRVRTTSGRHLGVYTNKATAVSTDDTVKDKLDTWYRVAAALGVAISPKKKK